MTLCLNSIELSVKFLIDTYAQVHADGTFRDVLDLAKLNKIHSIRILSLI